MFPTHGLYTVCFDHVINYPPGHTDEKYNLHFLGDFIKPPANKETQQRGNREKETESDIARQVDAYVVKQDKRIKVVFNLTLKKFKELSMMMMENDLMFTPTAFSTNKCLCQQALDADKMYST